MIRTDPVLTKQTDPVYIPLNITSVQPIHSQSSGSGSNNISHAGIKRKWSSQNTSLDNGFNLSEVFPVPEKALVYLRQDTHQSTGQHLSVENTGVVSSHLSAVSTGKSNDDYISSLRNMAGVSTASASYTNVLPSDNSVGDPYADYLSGSENRKLATADIDDVSDYSKQFKQV